MSEERTREIRRRLDEELSLDELAHAHRSTGEAATRFFQDLFVEVLGFEATPPPPGDATWRDLPVDAWPNEARANAARLVAKSGNFRLVYVELEKLSRTAERHAIGGLPRSDRTGDWAVEGSHLTVFHAPGEDVWHLVTPYEEGLATGRPVLRRYLLGAGETHRTVAAALGRVAASSGRLAERIDEAFRVEPVTEEFYEDYRSTFETLSRELRRKGLATEDADRYAHATLDRLAFLYHLQTKGWIGERQDFVRWFHERYDESADEGVFHEKWLSALFFDGMTRPEGASIDSDLPADVESAVAGLPFMNGELFQPTGADELDIFLSDSALGSVIREFLERYNFTVTDESPYDVDVAVDPAMLGKVYESLIGEQDREEAGVFYTPRVEVDLLCRSAVYEHLVDRTTVGDAVASRLVFSAPENYDGSDLSDSTIEDVTEALGEVRAVDPACGSGAFLIGMLRVLCEVHGKVGVSRDHDLGKRIVQRSVHGVDVEEWAVRVAEFRLWLVLLEGVDEVPGVRPVLPNFEFDLRVGDSIVQGGGSGNSLDSLHRSPGDAVRTRRSELRERKREFYRGEDVDPAEIRRLQRESLTEHIDQEIEGLQESSRRDPLPGEATERSDADEIRRLEDLKARVTSSPDEFFWDLDFADVMLDGGFDIVVGNPPYVERSGIVPQHLPRTRPEASDEGLKAEYRASLREYVDGSFGYAPPKSSDLYVYFFYRGIDVLREGGTLAYVTSNSWLDVKYGADLQGRLLQECDVEYVFDNRCRRTFEEAGVNTVVSILGRNPEGLEGTTSFVAFYRPYASCVEPGIVGDVFRGVASGSEYDLRFGGHRLDVTVTDHYRDLRVAESDLWELGGGEVSRAGAGESRSSTVATPSGRSDDGKWGRFLRAPDVYFGVLDEARERLTTVGELADVERGFTTGANDFFYLPTPGAVNRHFEAALDSQTGDLLLTPKDTDRRTRFRNQGFDVARPMFRIEKEYWMHEVDASDVPDASTTYESDGTTWVPNYVIKSPREVDTLAVHPDELSFVVLLVDGPRSTLQEGVADYLEWGERYEPKRYGVYAERATCAGRSPWYELDPKRARIFWIKSTSETHYTPFSTLPLYVDQRMYALEPKSGSDLSLAAALNSHLTSLVKEVEGRVNMGEGVLDTAVYEVPEYPVVDVSALSGERRTALENRVARMDAEVTDVWDELGTDEHDRVDLESVRADRRELDSALIVDVLGLSTDTQREIYRGLLRLVHERLSKARSA